MLGTDVILNIFNWVSSVDEARMSRLTELMCVAKAYLNAIYMAAEDRVGIEREIPFLGRRMIVGPDSEQLAGLINYEQEKIIYAECNLVDEMIKKDKARLNHFVLDGRIEKKDGLVPDSLRYEV